MQDSSAFQYLAIDQIHESTTNPRLTFEPSKLEELAESIRQHGLIQPITVRPNASGFEIVAGARRFRAAQLAELFSLPARIAELTDAQAMEWQLVENSQRVDVHPYEEAQGFQRLLEMPGYDVLALVAKSGKSASHIYARLSLLQLIPIVAEAFVQERITASHANLIARLPQEHQAAAFENCWRKDWSDKEAHLLPSKHLSAWIETNLYLNLADASFDRDDPTLNPDAGACASCPKRSGHNTNLFADVQGDQCLDGACFQVKVAVRIDRTLSENPQLVQIETTWRPVKEQRPGALNKNDYRVLDIADNPDAEPPCPNTKAALIVFGRGAGKTLTVCTDDNCPVHNPAIAAQIAKQQAENPQPVMEPAAPQETEEEAQARQAEYEQRRREYEAERERQHQECKAEEERQQEQYEAEQKNRDKEYKARVATLERIVEEAPVAFDAAQLRLFVELLLHLSPYGLFEEVAEHFVGDNQNNGKTDDEILREALAACADDKLTGFVLRLLLTVHTDMPRGEQTDLLAKAEAMFAPPQSKVVKRKDKKKPVASSIPKKGGQSKKAA
jgi:ParB family chromosome partitioning protein